MATDGKGLLGNILDTKEFDLLAFYKKTVEDSLLPCPLCKCTTVTLRVLPKENLEKVECWDCGLSLRKAIGVGVVKAWNKRLP